MLFELDTADGVPLYRQLVDQIRRMISGGTLRPGDELPSVRAVAEHYTINPMTVSRAYALLETEGWLERHRGKPMRVIKRIGEDREQRLNVIHDSLRKVVRDSRQLGLSAEEVISALENLFEESEQ
jgi:GntR family transcriptional regulator